MSLNEICDDVVGDDDVCNDDISIINDGYIAIIITTMASLLCL